MPFCIFFWSKPPWNNFILVILLLYFDTKRHDHLLFITKEIFLNYWIIVFLMFFYVLLSTYIDYTVINKWAASNGKIAYNSTDHHSTKIATFHFQSKTRPHRQWICFVNWTNWESFSLVSFISNNVSSNAPKAKI